MPSESTPTAFGYRMPAEWEPQEAVWLSWPHKEQTWPGAFEAVPGIFAQIAKVIAESEFVRINVGSDTLQQKATEALQSAGVRMDRVRFHRNPTNDSWVRDHGPIYIVHGDGEDRERALTNWGYNAWGGKYPPFDLDNQIPQRIAEESGELIFDAGMILEGGSIEVNGAGCLLTSESCLLNPNRNPELTKDQIEQRLKDFLSVTKILWLGDGIVGDDTDGHIDDMTRFVGPKTIVTVIEDDPGDENYEPLHSNLQLLQEMTDQDGRPFDVVTIPMPSPVYFDGERLPASYANFLITNRHVIVPIYNAPQDREALDTLQSLFPSREVVGIDCTKLVWGLGAIHCVTQQQPLCRNSDRSFQIT